MQIDPSSADAQPDDEGSAGSRRDEGTAASRRAERRERLRRWAAPVAGWTLAFGVVAALFAVPYPYVIESPGPTFNVLGHEEGKNVIEIKGRPEHRAKGELRMTTVYVTGGPDQSIHGVDLVKAWLGGQSRVLPVDEVYPPNVSRQQITESNRLEMDNSQSSAVAAALSHQHIAFARRLTVQDVVLGTPAQGVLKKGDVIERVGGAPAADVASLRKSVAKSGGAPVTVTVRRAGATKELTLKPVKKDGAYVLGVLLKNDFDFPFTPAFNLQNVGGPSAGMMFALGILDEIEPGDLTGGRSIAGTGTIDAEGKVGPIGGIQQKMAGARRDGAQYFLAPASNCGEVRGHVPDGLTVVRVQTLGQAYAAVEAIGRGQTPAEKPDVFPTCG